MIEFLIIFSREWSELTPAYSRHVKTAYNLVRFASMSREQLHTYLAQYLMHMRMRQHQTDMYGLQLRLQSLTEENLTEDIRVFVQGAGR